MVNNIRFCISSMLLPIRQAELRFLCSVRTPALRIVPRAGAVTEAYSVPVIQAVQGPAVMQLRRKGGQFRIPVSPSSRPGRPWHGARFVADGRRKSLRPFAGRSRVGGSPPPDPAARKASSHDGAPARHRSGPAYGTADKISHSGTVCASM